MSNTFCLFASSLSCYTYMSICLLKLFKRNQSRNDHVNFSSSHLIAMCKKPLANFQLQVDKQKPWHWTCDFIVIMLYTQRRIHWHFDPHRPLPETVRFLTISPQALQNVNHFIANTEMLRCQSHTSWSSIQTVPTFLLNYFFQRVPERGGEQTVLKGGSYPSTWGLLPFSPSSWHTSCC